MYGYFAGNLTFELLNYNVLNVWRDVYIHTYQLSSNLQTFKRRICSDFPLMYCLLVMASRLSITFVKKVQVGKDQEKAQSEKDSHSKN